MQLRRSRLTDRQNERLLDHFVAGTPARTAAELAGVNRNTARLFYCKLREIIAQNLARDARLQDAPGVDASRLKSPGTLPLFALLKSGRRVHVVMLQDNPRAVPSPASSPAAQPDAVVHADSAELPRVVDVSRFRHERARDRRRTSGGRAPIDNIENFWSQAKRHLRRYNGIPRGHLHLFLKECEWRFNFGSPRQLKRVLKSWIRAGAVRR